MLRTVAGEYIAAAKDALRLKEEFDWEAANPGRRRGPPALRMGSWTRFVDDGLILKKTHKKSFLRVSLWTYQRAFLVLQRLITQLEAAMFVLELKPDRQRLTATRDGAFVSIRLAEKMQVEQRLEKRPWSKEPEAVRALAPTGKLFISVEQQGLGEAQVMDGPSKPLEDLMHAVLATVEHQLQRSLATVEGWRRDREVREERARVARVEQELRDDARRVEQAEQERRAALMAEVGEWQQAQALRSYLAHLDARFADGGKPAEGYQIWRSWAGEVVSALDPSSRRVASSEMAVAAVGPADQGLG